MLAVIYFPSHNNGTKSHENEQKIDYCNVSN